MAQLQAPPAARQVVQHSDTVASTDADTNTGTDADPDIDRDAAAGTGRAAQVLTPPGRRRVLQ